MSNWTQGAKEYLEGYLGQVSALARENGDDAQEIVEQLRDHVAHEAAQSGAALVTIEHVRRILNVLGSPELVVQGEWKPVAVAGVPAAAPASAPPPMQPRVQPVPQVVIREKRSGALTCVVVLLVAIIGLPVLISIIGIIAGITLPAMSRAREAARRATCQNNLKQLGQLLFEYEAKHGALPPLSSTPGELMFDNALVGAPLEWLWCPSRGSQEMTVDGALDNSYLYLPYRIQGAEALETFVAGYREQLSRGLEAGAPLSVEGREALPWSSTEGWPGAGAAPAEVPLIIERPGPHVPPGVNVLYLDGHVEFIRFDAKWPVNSEYMKALHEVDKLDGDQHLIQVYE